jgi:glycosyltransferase involved in cell wall biosynthesis
VGSLLADDPYDIAVVHDPELLPAAIKQSNRGRTVVFDLHENLPAQIASHPSIPSLFRRPLSIMAARYLVRAERRLPMTLAESGYKSLFTADHAVFPNYPRLEGMPEPGGDPDGPIIYVGDITEARGIRTLVDAVGLMKDKRRLLVVGRYAKPFGDELLRRSAHLGVDMHLAGWLEHADAMQLVVESCVGVSPLSNAENYRRSLPTKTLEYLSLGVPVVASDLPGTRDVIGGLPGVTLVPPENAQELAEGLEHAISSHGGIGVDAEFVRTQFTWSDEEVLGFYRALLP